MYEITRFSFQRRVSLVIMLLDDFTGRPVADTAVTVSAVGQLNPPVRKSGGYFVFTDWALEQISIVIEAANYQRREQQIELSSLDPAYPVVKLRLMPNRNYRLPLGTTTFYGKAEPGSQIRLVEGSGSTIKLLYDYDPEQDGPELCLYNPDKEDMEGRNFIIKGKRSSKRDLFTVTKLVDEERGSCRLTQPLANAYKKASTSVAPLYSAAANAAGDYYLVLKSSASHAEAVVLEYEGLEGTASSSWPVKWGEANRIDLLAE